MSRPGRPMVWCFGLALLLLTRSAGQGLYAQDNAAAVVVAPQQSSAARSVIDVTCSDGVFVDKPLVRTGSYDKVVALENSQRIHAILTRAGIGPDIKVYFPAGHYYFEGTADGWLASIETTHPRQTIAGDGINATHLHQAGCAPTATIAVRHSRCAIENLSISSADHADEFVPDWDAHPHQAAIHLDAPPDNWSLDPQILNVTVNSTGNNIVVTDFFRPFQVGVRITGPWLNVYVHTMGMRDVFNAIYINQGERIAGPAKFIDVNVYATPPQGAPPDKVSKTWNTFFKSEGHFMEQVELIHCTYIGSQFIYMDGSVPSPGINPVYNMVVDHCYINTLWLPCGDAAQWSGIFMKLPPKPGGIVAGYGSPLYSKCIVFTNNTAAGKAPRDGAFFYVEGNLKQLTIAENHFASGGQDRCIYVRPAEALVGQDVGIHDVEIRHNVFNDFRNPVTIGDSALDPARRVANDGRENAPQTNVPVDSGRDTVWVDGVLIGDNQTFNLPVLEKGLGTTHFLHRARQVTISGNSYARTDGSALVLRDCQDIVMMGNNLPGFEHEAHDGVLLQDCANASLTGNLLRQFGTGVRLVNSRNVSLSGNQILDCTEGVRLDRVENSTLSGNLVEGSRLAVHCRDSRRIVATGNLLPSTSVMIEGANQELTLQAGWESGSAAAMAAGNAAAVVTRIRQLMEARGLQRHQESGRAYYSSYGDLYDWELYFDSLLLAYVGGEEYAVEGLRIFLSKQQANGFIPRRVPKRPAPEELDGQADALYAHERKEHCKPFLFQIALIIARTRGSVEWITPGDYRGLRAYLTHWLEQWDRDGNGLCEWSSAPHSGADTQLERIGPWGSRYCEGTDLNCFLYRELQAAAYIAQALGHVDDARAFTEWARRTAEAVRSILWDDTTAMFLDRDVRDGKRIAVKSAATFLPLAAGIATPQQATALVEQHLRNTAEFATPFPVPSYARSEPAYAQRYEPTDGAPPVLGIQSGHANWCGGMWPHWTIQISHGLQDYGFEQDARLLADQLFQALAAPEGFYEWYDAETGAGCGLNPFWAGATVLGAMLPAELASRFNPLEPRPVDQMLDFSTVRQVLGISPDFTPREIHD